MKLEQRMKNLKIKGKLNLYRMFTTITMIFLGIVAASLSLVMNKQVRDITQNWSPTLARVMEFDTLTSDYRMKQYGHLVASSEEEMANYDKELAAIEEQIQTVCTEFEGLISQKEEKALYENIIAEWNSYKSLSSDVIKLSRKNNIEEGSKLMVGKLYDSYNKFQDTFSQLKTYEETQLARAKKIVQNVFVTMLIIIAAVVIAASYLAMKLGKIITNLIAQPVAQITEAASLLYQGDMSAGKLINYEGTDELGIVADSLRGAMNTLDDYIEEISGNLKEIAKGDLTKDSDEITDFRGDFASIKESFIYILKRFNTTLSDIQNTSGMVADNASEIANASRQLSEGATDQASSIEELTATVNTVSNLAEENAKNSQDAYESISSSARKAEQEKKKMEELTEEMHRITEISKAIENIITAIEDIASQTNLLSLNASIEAARAGDAGKGFAVVADQIGKLAADSAQSAVNTRELIGKTLEEIEKGNAITIQTSEAFENVITDMKNFAEVAQVIMENVNDQAQALDQIEQGIEQISTVMQNTAASSQESMAIADNLSAEAETLDGLVKKFKLY